jgi:CHAT domain-containing protein/tetratricopeptide (TPR) repeat protein
MFMSLLLFVTLLANLAATPWSAVTPAPLCYSDPIEATTTKAVPESPHSKELPPQTTEHRLLEHDKPIERELRGNEHHFYRIPVASGQFVRVFVDQLSINVAIVLYGPDGSKLVQKNRSTIATETLLILGEPSSEYRLEILPVYEMRSPGRYQIKIAEVREGTARDLTLVKAQKLHSDGYSQTEWLNPEKNRLALLKLTEALKLWQEAGDQREEAHALFNIGYAEFASSQYEQARVHYEQALSIWRSLDERENEGNTLQMLGRVYTSSGDWDKADEYLSRAVELQRAIRNKEGELSALKILGMHQRGTEDYEQALETFGSYLSLSRAVGNPTNEATSLAELGLTYWWIGDYQKAVDFYHQALSLWRGLGNRAGEHGTLEYLGLTYYAMGEYQKALEYYSQALPFSRARGHRSLEADTLMGIASVYAGLNDHQKALQTMNEALGMYRQVGNRWGVPYALRNIAGVHIALKDPSRALTYFTEALPLDRALRDQTAEAKGRAGIALAYRDLGELNKARTNIEESLDIIERLRSRLQNQDLRASFFASKLTYYQFYIDLLMRLDEQKRGAGFDVAALQASERARSRSLLDLLAEARVNVTQDISPILKQRERDNQTQISLVNSRLIQALGHDPPNPQLVAQLSKETSRNEDLRAQLVAEIRKAHPKYAELKYPTPLKLEAIQALLDDDTAFLEYSLGEHRSFLFVVSKQGLRSYTLPPANEINRLVEEVRSAVARPGRREFGRFVSAALKLYEVLVAPAGNSLNDKKKLLIAPDAALYYLPFEALLVAPPQSPSTEMAYLLKRWGVSYVPSASVLANLRQDQGERKVRRTEFLAFADPIYFQQQQPSDNQLAQVMRSIFDEEGKLSLLPLKDSHREVAAIAKFYQPHQTALYFGAAAKEESVKSNQYLADARRIHFATHGLISERMPHHSGLVLTLDEDLREDGLLQVYEIFNLKLNADLVVLSACRTGLGKEVRGEGVIGLTRAFLYAGASSLTVSLWQVGDQSTSDLMINFYAQLNAGNSKTEALRQAKLQMIGKKRYIHPFYWAPFVLIGEP